MTIETLTSLDETIMISEIDMEENERRQKSLNYKLFVNKLLVFTLIFSITISLDKVLTVCVITSAILCMISSSFIYYLQKQLVDVNFHISACKSNIRHALKEMYCRENPNIIPFGDTNLSIEAEVAQAFNLPLKDMNELSHSRLSRYLYIHRKYCRKYSKLIQQIKNKVTTQVL